MGWVKGQSGNPGGRKGIPKDIRTKLKDLTPKALAALERELSKEEAGAAAVAAARVVLGYALGQPGEPLISEEDESGKARQLSDAQILKLVDAYAKS